MKPSVQLRALALALTLLGGVGVAHAVGALDFPEAWRSDGPPKIEISVWDLHSDQPIKNGAILQEPTEFQVRIDSEGAGCAGQFVVTALGAPGLPPSVIVEAEVFIVGPNELPAFGVGLDTGVENSWKISATCNGASKNAFDADFLQFDVNAGPPPAAGVGP